jgi:hypothetical protein
LTILKVSKQVDLQVYKNGTVVALMYGKRDEVSSFPSFPPPTNPVRHPPLAGFFFGSTTFWQKMSKHCQIHFEIKGRSPVFIRFSAASLAFMASASCARGAKAANR